MKGTGRNAPCLCGSGKKDKRCCAEGPPKAKVVTVRLIWLPPAALAGWVVTVRASGSGVSASRVWSGERARWHDVR